MFMQKLFIFFEFIEGLVKAIVNIIIKKFHCIIEVLKDNSLFDKMSQGIDSKVHNGN